MLESGSGPGGRRFKSFRPDQFLSAGKTNNRRRWNKFCEQKNKTGTALPYAAYRIQLYNILYTPARIRRRSCCFAEEMFRLSPSLVQSLRTRIRLKRHYDVPISIKTPLLPGSVKDFLNGLRGGAGAGGAYLRCSGIRCIEDLAGNEGGGFVQIGPAYGFHEGGPHGGSCTGGGVEAGGGFSVGGFGCHTTIGKSWTF